MPSAASYPLFSVEFDRSREHWRNHKGSYSEVGAIQLKESIDLLRRLWANGKLSDEVLKVTISIDPFPVTKGL